MQLKVVSQSALTALTGENTRNTANASPHRLEATNLVTPIRKSNSFIFMVGILLLTKNATTRACSTRTTPLTLQMITAQTLVKRPVASTPARRTGPNQVHQQNRTKIFGTRVLNYGGYRLSHNANCSQAKINQWVCVRNVRSPERRPLGGGASFPNNLPTFRSTDNS